MQATEAVLQIALTPTANSMAVTVELLGHLKIRRAVRCRSPEDQPATKGQGLGVEWARTIDSKWDCSSHATVTWGARGTGIGELLTIREEIAKHDTTMPPILYVVPAKIYWRRIYEMDI